MKTRHKFALPEGMERDSLLTRLTSHQSKIIKSGSGIFLMAAGTGAIGRREVDEAGAAGLKHKGKEIKGFPTTSFDPEPSKSHF